MFTRSILLFSLILCSGCNAIGLERTWHQKFNWKAEDYFQDEKVIALCKAIEANDLVEMKRLIAAGANFNALGKGNMTPLLWAIPDNHPERVRLLLEKGANPNVYITTDLGLPKIFLVGDSVTHMVCRSYFPYFDDVFEFGGDPNLPDKAAITTGQTPIFIVIKNGGGDAKRRIKILLNKGADINQRVYSTPFLQAITWGGQYDLAMFLIENGADFKAYTHSELTRGIHFLAQDFRGLLKTASAQQKADYDKLVKFLEEHGESIAEANKDWARWEANVIRYGREANYEIEKQEIAERKKREQDAKEQVRMK